MNSDITFGSFAKVYLHGYQTGKVDASVDLGTPNVNFILIAKRTE